MFARRIQALFGKGEGRLPALKDRLPLVFGLALLFSTLQVYSSVMIALPRFNGMLAFMHWYALLLLLAVFACSGALVLLRLTGHGVPDWLVAWGVRAAYPVSSFLLAFVACGGGDPFAILCILLPISCWAVCSAILHWGRASARLRMREALAVVSLASVLSVALCFAYARAPLAAFFLLYLAASVAMSGLSCVVSGPSASGVEGAGEVDGSRLEGVASDARGASGGGAAADGGGAPDGNAAPGSCAGPHEAASPHAPQGRSSLGSLIESLGAPLLGLMTFAFVVAVLRGEFARSQEAYLFTLAVDGGLLALFSRVRKGPFSQVGDLLDLVLPIAAIAFLALSNFASVSGSLSSIVELSMYSIFSLAAILALATLCAVAEAGEYHPDAVFLSALSLFSGASFAGQLIAGLTHDGYQLELITGSVTVLSVVLVLISFRRLRAGVFSVSEEVRVAGGDSEGESDAGSPLPRSIGRREICAEVARAHGLTRREEEILSYLAEGHGGAYIAGVLYISQNTARTHIHNIYRKLGVSSREEVLQLTKPGSGSLRR